MHLMSYRGFVAEVERDPELGVFVGTLSGVRYPVRFQAPSLTALPGQMAGAVDDYIAWLQEWGQPFVRAGIGDRRVRVGRVRKPA